MTLKRAEPVVVVLLLAGFAVMGLTAAEHHSPTFDEVPHLTAGYSIWAGGDHRVADPTHLPQWWYGMPLNLMDVNFVERDDPFWRWPDELLLGHKVMYHRGNDPMAMIRAGRIMAALLAVALGAGVWRCSRSLFGRAGGMLSLAVFAFSPSMLTHGFLTTADLPAAMGLLAATWCLWRMLVRPTWRRIVVSAVAVGTLCLIKASGILIVVVAVLLLTVRLIQAKALRRRWPRLCAAAAVHVVIGAVMIWGFYHFRYDAFRDAGEADQGFRWTWDKLLSPPTTAGNMVRYARDHRLLPESYLRGLANYVYFTSGRSAFMDGKWTESAWATFFPYTALVKTPLSLFVLWGCAAAGWRWRRTAPWWVLLGVYWAAAITSEINIGHRHLMPVYPPMFILIGAAMRGRRGVRVVVGLALVMLIAESLWIWPHYLSYFNVIAGGPTQAHKRLVDSSLDWGQDLPALSEHLQRHPPQPDEAVYFAYFGTADPQAHGIDAEPLRGYYTFHPRSDPPRRLRPGIYCVSATMLQSVYQRYRGPWCKPYEQLYQAAFLRVVAWSNADADAEARQALLKEFPQDYWAKLFDDFERLRVARLFAMLRHREPDARAGYSILIYHLTEADVLGAETGPPAELFEQVQVEQ